MRTLRSATPLRIDSLELSPSGDLLAAGTLDGRLQVWDARGRPLAAPVSHRGGVLALSFSSDGSTLASGGLDNVIHVWDVVRGVPLRTLEGHASAVTALAYDHRRGILASGSEDATIKFWNARDGVLLASATSIGTGSWLVMSPEGFFDGTRRSWNAVPFRFPSAPDRFFRPEQFFNQFFQPRLLADVVGRRQSILDLLRERNDPRAALSVAAYATSQLPVVELAMPSSAIPSPLRTLRIAVSATNRGSGLRDLRVFRNQSLVASVRGDLPIDPSTGRFSLTVPVDISAGPNEITAYAFNDDGLKSVDATISVTGSPSLRRQGTAYILAVGVNRHDNAEFNLQYAAPDALLLERELAASLRRLGAYADVVTVALTDERATKRNVLDALRRLAGEEPALHPEVAEKLLTFRRTTAEDVVIIHFAGHGESENGRYFLLPHDTGYKGSRQRIAPVDWQAMVSRSISDQELSEAMERIDSAQMLLVIDACQSGRVLGADGNRLGPFNSRDFAQLAYEKGAHVLAAAQSNQAALEFQRLGHGLLTYTLVEKGLKSYGSDRNGDRRITAAEWFAYAEQQVPIELAALMASPQAAGRPVTVDGQLIGTQRPRTYNRRDRTDDLLIATR